MSDEILTEQLTESEPVTPAKQRTDTLDAIKSELRQRALETEHENEERQETESEGRRVTVTGQDEQGSDTGANVLQQESGSEEGRNVQSESLLSKWTPVLKQVNQGKDLTPEQQGQFIDNLMASWTGLQSNPMQTLMSIAEAYLPKEELGNFVTAMTHKAGLDPLDIDVDQYAASQPNPEVAALQQQVQKLQVQNMNNQIASMKASGDYPLLNNQAFVQQMASAFGQYGMDLQQAYHYTTAMNPNLAAQAAPAVEEPEQTRRRLARKGDILPSGKPNGEIYRDIPRNPVDHLRMMAKEMIN